MNPREVLEFLRPDNFTACVFLTTDGREYEVRHPELVRVSRHGSLHVYFPRREDDIEVENWAKLACRNITAIRPLL